MEISEIVQKPAVARFIEAFETIPGATAQLVARPLTEANGNESPIFRIRCGIDKKEFTLLALVKKDIYPRDARDLIWRAEMARGNESALSKHETVPLVVADYISEGAKVLLKEQHCGFFDSGGSMFLRAADTFIWIEKSPAKAPARQSRSLFFGRRAQVLHAALMTKETMEWFGVNDMAKSAQVSASTASEVLVQLDRHGWTEAKGSGPAKLRKLVEPSALLDAWSTEVRSEPAPATRRYFVPGISASTGSTSLIGLLSGTFWHHRVRYGITAEAAGQFYAPHLTQISQVRIRAVVDKILEDALHNLGAREVSEGANLILIESPSGGDLLFMGTDVYTKFVSPVMAYLDLLRGPGRSKEAAQFLRTQKIGF